VVIPIGTLVAVVLGADLDRVWSDSPPSTDQWLATAGAVLASLLYFPAIMRATDGRTLGKMATRIRVVRTDRKAMSFTRAAWREAIVKAVPSLLPGLFFIVALLDDLWPLWDPQNRAIHDMLAGTRVVRSDSGRRDSHKPD
jgi:uncharacterized RDD family membrane protein YckC